MFSKRECEARIDRMVRVMMMVMTRMSVGDGDDKGERKSDR